MRTLRNGWGSSWNQIGGIRLNPMLCIKAYDVVSISILFKAIVIYPDTKFCWDKNEHHQIIPGSSLLWFRRFTQSLQEWGSFALIKYFIVPLNPNNNDGIKNQYQISSFQKMTTGLNSYCQFMLTVVINIRIVMASVSCSTGSICGNFKDWKNFR